MSKTPDSGKAARCAGRLDRRAISGQGSRALRAEPRAHGRAGRQGRLRLGRAARKGRGARQRRRAGGRHGQDLLQAHRILAVRSAARAGSADAAVLRLYDRLGERHPAASAASRGADDAVKPERGDKRFQDPEWGQQRLLRFPQAGLSRHLALGRRPGRACRWPRRAHPPQGRLLRQADLQRDLAVQLHPHQSGAVSRDGRLATARTWCAA